MLSNIYYLLCDAFVWYAIKYSTSDLIFLFVYFCYCFSRIRRDSPKRNTTKKVGKPGSPASDQGSLCARRSFVTKTKDIFGARAIAPLSFNAYDCTGKCDYTAASHSFNNHAIVRSLAVTWDREINVTSPWCVPTSFNSLTALLYYGKDHVVLRQFPDMVAKECGCR